MNKTKAPFLLWIAMRLPRRLVYWCAIRVYAEATSGPKHSHEVVPDLRAMDALERWDSEEDVG